MRRRHRSRLVAAGLVWLALLAVDRPAAAQQGEHHPDLPRMAGLWRGAAGGWELALDVTRRTITPSRSLLRIDLVCRDEAGTILQAQHGYGHIVDARQVDLLIRVGAAGGPLIRLHGTVPDLALATVAGWPACARRTELPLERAR